MQQKAEEQVKNHFLPVGKIKSWYLKFSQLWLLGGTQGKGG